MNNIENEIPQGVPASLLSLSLDDSRITWGECLGRTRWSSSLDLTVYLYYFYKWLYTTSPWSHDLLECSTITWQGHVIQLFKFPRYLYPVCIVWLDICNRVFKRMGNLFFLGALITLTNTSLTLLGRTTGPVQIKSQHWFARTTPARWIYYNYTLYVYRWL